MTDNGRVVVGGVDCHKQTHHAFVLTEQGQRLADREFAPNSRGYRELVEWMCSHGELARVGVESTGSYGAGLCRYLRQRGLEVIDVNRPHKRLREKRGKSDPIDAEGAARSVLAGEATVIAKDSTGVDESIRQLRVARETAVKARTAALCALGELIVSAPAGLRESLDKRKTLAGQAVICAKLRPDPSRLAEPAQAARAALRSLGRRIADLDAEIKQLDAQLRPLVSSAAPRTIALVGIGTQHARQLLVAVGQNMGRLRGEAAFARMSGAAPIPASSGQTRRYRLNPHGNRDTNRTLHLVAVVRLRYWPATRAYAERRRAEGLSNKDIVRCLKRYIARQVYRTLRSDLAVLESP
jgi:transposase